MASDTMQRMGLRHKSVGLGMSEGSVCVAQHVTFGLLAAYIRRVKWTKHLSLHGRRIQSPK